LEDLYLKENPFNIPHVGSNVEASANASNVDDVNEVQKSSVVSTSIDVEKGNPDETLKFDTPKSAEILGIDNLKVAKNTKCDDMNVDKPMATVKIVDESVVGDTTTSLPEKFSTHNVGSDVGTSLNKHDKQGNVDETILNTVKTADVGPDVETSLGQKEKQADEGVVVVETDTGLGFKILKRMKTILVILL
jgi:hypothetical protein